MIIYMLIFIKTFYQKKFSIEKYLQKIFYQKKFSIEKCLQKRNNQRRNLLHNLKRRKASLNNNRNSSFPVLTI